MEKQSKPKTQPLPFHPAHPFFQGPGTAMGKMIL
jgi:hypothetical protein